MPTEESMGRASAELLAQRLSAVRNQEWLARLLDEVRLDEFRDAIVLAASKDFTAEEKKEYIKGRVAQLGGK
jgi:hypothetical protein